MRLTREPLAAVCGHEEAKRAALLFDTVHVALSPTHVFEDGDIRESFFHRKTDFLQPYIIKDAMDFSHSIKQIEIRLRNACLGFNANYDLLPRIQSEALIDLANVIADKGIKAVPLYSSLEMLQSEIAPRDHKIYKIILDNIPIIDPINIKWSQIEETREDIELRQRYRDLRLWMTSIDDHASISQISDILEKRMELYRGALRKHGIRTVLGALSVFVDPKKLAAVSAAITSTMVFGNIELSTVVGTIIFASECTLRIAEHCINKEDIRSKYPEVALLHDIAGKAKA